VPRNCRGNVEVPPFAAKLPAGTVHIDISRAAAAARRLGVDAAPALVGFEPGRQGGMVPVIRGVVVCEEYAQSVTDAAQEDERERQARARAKLCVPVPTLRLCVNTKPRLNMLRSLGRSWHVQ
jgi:xeroderma pigmentosum group C-complementing protein